MEMSLRDCSLSSYWPWRVARHDRCYLEVHPQTFHHTSGNSTQERLLRLDTADVVRDDPNPKPLINYPLSPGKDRVPRPPP